MILHNLRQKVKSASGQSYSEYIIIVLLIAIACIIVYSMFGRQVREGVKSAGMELAGIPGNQSSVSTPGGNGANSGNGTWQPGGQNGSGSGTGQGGNGASQPGGQNGNGSGSGQGGNGKSQPGGQNGSDGGWTQDIPPQIGDQASLGPPSDTCNNPNMVLDPINIFNGNHVESDVDLRFNSPFQGGFGIVRSYNSRDPQDSAVGHGWRLNYHMRLDVSHIPVNSKKFFNSAQLPKPTAELLAFSELETNADAIKPWQYRRLNLNMNVQA